MVLFDLLTPSKEAICSHSPEDASIQGEFVVEKLVNLGKQRMEPSYTESGGSETMLLKTHGNAKTAFRPHLF
jgi:hypothetical protein